MTPWRLLGEPRRARLRTQFYRCLAVLLTSGVPLIRALEILAQQLDDPEFRTALERAAQRLLEGQRLSLALNTGPFPIFHLRLLAVGEESGSLHLVLDRLGDECERSNRLAMQVFAALTYPCLVLLVTLLLVLWSQHYVLSGLLKLLQSLNVPLPLATRVLVRLSAILDHPLGLLSLGLGGWLLGELAWRRRHRLRAWLYASPLLGQALREALQIQYTRSLAMCLRVGVPMLQAIRMLEFLDPLLCRPSEHLALRLQEGDTLSKAWLDTDFLSPLVGRMLRAGEESGKMVRLLEQAADLLEMGLETLLDSVTAALQPAVMLLVGLVVAFVLVGTLSPLLQVVQSL